MNQQETSAPKANHYMIQVGLEIRVCTSFIVLNMVYKNGAEYTNHSWMYDQKMLAHSQRPKPQLLREDSA